MSQKTPTRTGWQPKTNRARMAKLNARPDTLDFRDLMFTPTLVEVPSRVALSNYQEVGVPILDQENEGACTGFGLATVVNYLLRRRKPRDANRVSALMLYDLARRYDEWPGEDYEGSSCRGAMKGWHRHGVCSWDIFPFPRVKEQGNCLGSAQFEDGTRRPLGAYFRVNHRDLVAMHAAIAEVGVLYASGVVHEGWDDVDDDGLIPLTDAMLGGHAFAIVAYDDEGFWIQNSWGDGWGLRGFAKISYDDWLINGTDAWVARLGAPVKLKTQRAIAVSASSAAGKSAAYSFGDLRRHIVSLGNDGRFRPGGDFGTSTREVEAIFKEFFPARADDWTKELEAAGKDPAGNIHLLFYAHGGLVDERSSVQRLSDYLPAMLANRIYPVSFIWHSDLWSTLRNILQEAVRRRRPEGILDDAKDFMLDRLDDALEPVARTLGGKGLWDEMKENAELATTGAAGGIRASLDVLAQCFADPASRPRIHVVGHSAGSIVHARLVEYLTGTLGWEIDTCTLWAPACTTALFKECYVPALESGAIKHCTLFTLTDAAEQDDHCANIYNKSLLYLVSHACETEPRIPLFRGGVPILGMETHVRDDATLVDLVEQGKIDWILTPNDEPEGSPRRSNASRHGDFDDDVPTLKSTLARIVSSSNGLPRGETGFAIHRSEAGLRARRRGLTQQLP